MNIAGTCSVKRTPPLPGLPAHRHHLRATPENWQQHAARTAARMPSGSAASMFPNRRPAWPRTGSGPLRCARPFRQPAGRHPAAGHEGPRQRCRPRAGAEHSPSQSPPASLTVQATPIRPEIARRSTTSASHQLTPPAPRAALSVLAAAIEHRPPMPTGGTSGQPPSNRR